MQPITAKLSLAALLFAASLSPARAQEPPGAAEAPAAGNFASQLRALPLDEARRLELSAALTRRDYRQAETILVDEINRRDPPPPALLTFAASLFFLDGQYLNAAIAYKKAEAQRPLDAPSRFTLAMAYVRLGRREWARPELTKLAADFPQQPLYLYWLARLDYDAQDYSAAIAKLERVIELDPQMMRAYDNLGLCYDYLGRSAEAIKHYRRAIELNRRQARPSPWPHVNLAALLVSAGELSEAERLLGEALKYDARLPQAHYQLGLLLEKQGRPDGAEAALSEAVRLDPNYAEPHYTLGRIYQRRGEAARAKEAFAEFQRLKKAKR
jgi:tetratricopeptide (TPR) repeat protein